MRHATLENQNGRAVEDGRITHATERRSSARRKTCSRPRGKAGAALRLAKTSPIAAKLRALNVAPHVTHQRRA